METVVQDLQLKPFIGGLPCDWSEDQVGRLLKDKLLLIAGHCEDRRPGFPAQALPWRPALQLERGSREHHTSL